MYGLTMRSYKEAVQQFSGAHGLEKSTTSDHFIEDSRRSTENAAVVSGLLGELVESPKDLVTVATLSEPSGQR